MSETAKNPWLVDEFELDDGIITAVILGGVRYVKERTCNLDTTLYWDCYYEHELSCGHVIKSDFETPPNFCEECGAKVVSE